LQRFGRVLPDTVVAPGTELLIDRLPRGIDWHLPPLAAGLHDAQHPIHDPAQLILVRSPSATTVQTKKVLKECAPGYRIRLANHSRVIHFGGKVYRPFPKADPIENGHIRKLVRFLGIDTICAVEHLPEVINAESAAPEPVVSEEKSKPETSPTKSARKK
jgi:hypothetical protein